MVELTKGEYIKAAPLLQGIPFDTVYAHAVIEGRQTGRVFADCAHSPGAVFIWHYCGMSLLTGNTNNNAFADAVCGLLLNNHGKEFGHLRIATYPNEWDTVLATILGEKLMCFANIDCGTAGGQSEYAALLKQIASQKVIQYSRAVFHFRHYLFEKRKPDYVVPDGFAIVPIDEASFERLEGSVVPRYYWETPADFVNGGFGLCLMEGDKIASAAFSAYIGGGSVDIGIETSPEYRKKGLGAVIGAAMVEECLQRGFRPVWGCRRDNEGSFKLAEKLGYELSMCPPIYFAVK